MNIGTKESPVRLSFVNLHEPALAVRNDPNSKLQYSVDILIDKQNTVVIDAVNKGIAQAIEMAIGKGRIKEAEAKSKSFWTPLRDGDERAEEKPDTYAAYKGHYYIKAKTGTESPPIIVDRFLKLIPVERKDEVYSGCYAIVDGNFSVFKHESGTKGASFYLGSVMKRADGDRLDGRKSANEAFGELADTPEIEDNEGEDDLR